ncbi:MAG: DUF222 domain-containing protein, partial [Actinobacteria bacterium]|nr:DUF222 domain-containing protein [Actinomycetota bacterium]
LVEGHSRGLHLDTGLSVHDWVAARCPGLTRAAVSDLAAVVKAWDVPGHACLRQAVTGGQVSPARAAKLIRALARVAPVTDPATYEDVVGLLTPVAAHGSDKDLRDATDHLVAVALSAQEGEAKATACQDSRGIHESSLADGSLRRFIITADAEGAATIHAILSSPLAAPAPDETGPDERTPSQRRYDALMSVLGRGMATGCAGAGTGTGTGAGGDSVDAGNAFTAPGLLLGSAGLLGGAGEVRWPAPGLGRAFTGEGLSPGQVRRLACQADLIPVVLGTHSEVLDLGRESRLATPAQLKRLWLRDPECTFPGCSVPNTWCDAHHIIWWSRNGHTDILNLALLCGRHHTIVHTKDLRATVDATGVTWHL